MCRKLQDGEAAAHEISDERRLFLVTALELELQPAARFVHVDDAGLFDQKALEPIRAAGHAYREDAALAHARENLLDGARREDSSLVDERDGVAHFRELGEDVRAEQDRLAVA